MYDKGDVIRRIGFHNWSDFEMWAMERVTEYDEAGFELYHPQDVDDFKLEHGIK